jgi:hypothetical protein
VPADYLSKPRIETEPGRCSFKTALNTVIIPIKFPKRKLYASLDGRGFSQQRIERVAPFPTAGLDTLFFYSKDGVQISEVILATNPTTEGEGRQTTSVY